MVIFLVWLAVYLSIDLIMWAGGRSTLISNILISIPMVLSAAGLTVMLNNLRHRLADAPSLSAAPFLLIAAVIAATAQTLVDYLAVRTAATTLFPDWREHIPTQSRQFGFGIYVYTLHFVMCLLFVSLLRAYRSIVRTAERQAEVTLAHRRAEAKALRLQLSPHFLFNALNSIATLVSEGGNRVADTMICRLSDFLRASITGDLAADVSLSSELATIESYLAIERMRFGQRLSTRFDIAPDVWDAAVPALILQPLAENAIKHGLSARGSSIELTITVRRSEGQLIMSVEDTQRAGEMSETAIPARGLGVGLSNISERLALFDADNAGLETEKRPDGFCATLRLPFRPIPPRLHGPGQKRPGSIAAQ
ncbi:MAG: histidine kinase [Sphingopyxis sp.]|uniref:sensor histidine kinase n=1 Tax=Sphingopyxis sp. TaxID=1908224 RepID=UPI002AB92F77|nr:histidine kinase [Sphingopyxis sp.]MDZ3832320.1 histidine kinase [Sphingopyxis sp.]